MVTWDFPISLLNKKINKLSNKFKWVGHGGQCDLETFHSDYKKQIN